MSKVTTTNNPLVAKAAGLKNPAVAINVARRNHGSGGALEALILPNSISLPVDAQVIDKEKLSVRPEGIHGPTFSKMFMFTEGPLSNSHRGLRDAYNRKLPDNTTMFTEAQVYQMLMRGHCQGPQGVSGGGTLRGGTRPYET